MKYRKLGSLEIPAMAVGTWSWGTGKNGGDAVFGNSLQAADLKPIFEKAVECGFSLWDTAYVYGMGASEQILAELAKESGKEILVSTKFTPPSPRLGMLTMEEMFAESRRNLGRESIDLYWIHNPGDVEKWTPAVIPYVKEGKVKYVGVSNHDLEQAKRAAEILDKEGIKLAAVQNHYSLLYRGAEHCGLLDWAKANDMVFFSYMVLEQGALTGRFSAANPLPAGSRRGTAFGPEELTALEPLFAEMRTMGEAHGVDTAQIAVAWAIAKGTVPIVGMTKLKQVESNLGAIDVELTEAEVSRLEATATATGIKRLGVWEKDMDV